MTLKTFELRLKALLREAEDTGLGVEEFCQIAESILANGWARENDQYEEEIND